MTDSDQGTARRGIGRVADQVSGAAQSARSRVGPNGTTEKPAGRTSDKAATTSPAAAESPAPAPVPEPASAQAPRAESSPSPTPTRKTGRNASKRKPRKAHLRLVQLDAWSVMKTAFLLSIAIGIVTVVAVGIVWTVLGAAGVWDSLNNTVQTVMGNRFQIQDYIGTSRVLGFTMLVAVVDVVLLTAIATLGAFLYNLAATLLGGVELTLAEDT